MASWNGRPWAAPPRKRAPISAAYCPSPGSLCSPPSPRKRGEGHRGTAPGALQRLYMLERACELELLARQMNAKTVIIEDRVVHAIGERIRAARDSDAYGLMEWQALVRTVEKNGADFRK